MQGVIKWFSESEGLGVIEADTDRFCFSLGDFAGSPREGQVVKFEPANKKISLHDELLPLAYNIVSD